MSLTLHTQSCPLVHARSQLVPAALVSRQKLTVRRALVSRSATRSRCARVCAMGTQGASQDASKASQGTDLKQVWRHSSRDCRCLICDRACKPACQALFLYPPLTEFVCRVAPSKANGPLSRVRLHALCCCL